MDIAFLLHLYQPPTQTGAKFREIFDASYAPLIKTIKDTPNFRISLNIPLSLLEQMDKYGHTSWIEEVKALVKSEKIELVGSAAYHPLLSKLPRDFVEKQIVINEYGLGYYFGRHTGFEGEKAILIKDLVGFFPPELAVNENLISVLDDLKYSWVLVDGTAIPDDPGYYPKYGVYKLQNYNVRIVCRNRIFSNMLSFKRDLDMSKIVDSLSFFEANDRPFVVVLDAEFFGHHFAGGLHVLHRLLESLEDMGSKVVTVGEYLELVPTTNLWELRESSWGASDTDMTVGDIYPMWAAPKNKIHILQWEMVSRLLETYAGKTHTNTSEGCETLPVWLPESIKRIEDESERAEISLDLLVNQALHSDQFWWASGKGLPTGEILYSPEMVEASLKLFGEVSRKIGNADFTHFIEEKSAEIRKLL